MNTYCVSYCVLKLFCRVVVLTGFLKGSTLCSNFAYSATGLLVPGAGDILTLLESEREARRLRWRNGLNHGGFNSYSELFFVWVSYCNPLECMLFCPMLAVVTWCGRSIGAGVCCYRCALFVCAFVWSVVVAIWFHCKNFHHHGHHRDSGTAAPSGSDMQSDLPPVSHIIRNRALWRAHETNFPTL